MGEHRSSGERKYYLSNLPPDTALKQLASLIKARWVCEQAHQQLKEELGLDHFEGRSWRGLHRHALLTLIAYLFLQHLRLQAATGGKKKRQRTTTAPQLTGHPAPAARSSGAHGTSAMSDLPGPLHPWITDESAKVVLIQICQSEGSSGPPEWLKSCELLILRSRIGQQAVDPGHLLLMDCISGGRRVHVRAHSDVVELP